MTRLHRVKFGELMRSNPEDNEVRVGLYNFRLDSATICRSSFIRHTGVSNRNFNFASKFVEIEFGDPGV